MAGRIRTIKPDLLDSERFAQLSDAGVRLFIGCMSLVDDAGVCPAGPTYLGGRIFYARPRSAISIGKLLGELERARLVDLFVVDRAQYLAIVGWTEKGSPTYQRIDRPQASQIPLPKSVRSWNGSAAGSDQIRSDPKGGESSRAIPGVAPAHVTAPAPAEAPPIVPPVSRPPSAREDIARTQPVAKPGSGLTHPPSGPAPGEPTLEQLWTELEQSRQRAAAARGVSVRPLVAHDSGRADLADALAEAARVGARDKLVGDVRHAIAAAESEARVAPEPGKPDQLRWFTGAIFRPNNFRRLAGTPMKLPAAPRPAPKQLRPPDVEPMTDEDRAEIAELARKVGAGRADAAAAEERARRVPNGVAAKPTAELVRMFGAGERAPPSAARGDEPADDHDDKETA